MATDLLVSSLDEVKANIERYERELARSKDLQAIMSYAREWYAYPAEDGGWRVGPSKFVGYANNSAKAYVRLHRERDGRRTERALSPWFDKSSPGTAAYEDITAAVKRLFAKYGRTPNKSLGVNAPKPERDAVAEGSRASKRDRPVLRSRISFDAGVCGGRPCIRGMRIRVSDILAMLSAGATRQEILADYPYLEDDDISAALDYGAESVSHRVVDAA